MEASASGQMGTGRKATLTAHTIAIQAVYLALSATASASVSLEVLCLLGKQEISMRNHDGRLGYAGAVNVPMGAFMKHSAFSCLRKRANDPHTRSYLRSSGGVLRDEMAIPGLLTRYDDVRLEPIAVCGLRQRLIWGSLPQAPRR